LPNLCLTLCTNFKFDNMKKNLLIVVAIFLATSLSAQLYVGGKLGYGFGAQKTDFGFTQTVSNETVIWGSLGQGFAPGLKVGYFFNDNLGFELGINYLMGATITAADVNITGYTNLTEAKTTQIRLLPQLVYKTDMGVYGRFGMLLPVSGATYVSQTKVSGAVTTVSEIEYHGTISLGFAGALGYEFELSDNLKLFGEMEYNGLTIRGKTATVTKYEVNGTDMLSALTTIQKETVFVDELTATSNNPSYNSNADATKALDDIRSSNGYSGFFINVGIHYYL